MKTKTQAIELAAARGRHRRGTGIIPLIGSRLMLDNSKEELGIRIISGLDNVKKQQLGGWVS